MDTSRSLCLNHVDISKVANMLGSSESPELVGCRLDCNGCHGPHSLSTKSSGAVENNKTGPVTGPSLRPDPRLITTPAVKSRSFSLAHLC
ncbi:hypothetical protein VTJ83DRAFT_5589 [Remersonia thermophila]|uniref:Uncharacterized protein n=1 Tax=Remersonia thermophila TaxID=72144 RepID=A0ABR4D9G6_9PEZI